MMSIYDKTKFPALCVGAKPWVSYPQSGIHRHPFGALPWGEVLGNWVEEKQFQELWPLQEQEIHPL